MIIIMINMRNNCCVDNLGRSHNMTCMMYQIFQSIFLGLYCLMNLLLAVIYSQFQGYLKVCGKHWQEMLSGSEVIEGYLCHDRY